MFGVCFSNRSRNLGSRRNEKKKRQQKMRQLRNLTILTLCVFNLFFLYFLLFSIFFFFFVLLFLLTRPSSRESLDELLGHMVGLNLPPAFLDISAIRLSCRLAPRSVLIRPAIPISLRIHTHKLPMAKSA